MIWSAHTFSKRIALDMTRTSLASIAVIAGLVILDAASDQIDLTLRGISDISPFEAVFGELPYLLTYIIPLGAVAGCSIVLGRLFGMGEATLLYALGMSPYTLWRATMAVIGGSIALLGISQAISQRQAAKPPEQDNQRAVEQFSSVEPGTPVQVGDWYLYLQAKEGDILRDLVAINPAKANEVMIVSAAHARVLDSAENPGLRLEKSSMVSLPVAGKEDSKEDNKEDTENASSDAIAANPAGDGSNDASILALRGATLELALANRTSRHQVSVNPPPFIFWTAMFLLAICSFLTSQAPRCSGGRHLLLLSLSLPAVAIGVGILKELVGNAETVPLANHLWAAAIVVAIAIAGHLALHRQHIRA